MSTLDRDIAAIAAEQHALFTLRQVTHAGGNRNDACRRVNAGRWESPYEEVYRLAGAPWTYEAEVLAGILAAGDGACASYKCACRLLGIGFKFAKPEITIKRGTFFRPTGITVHTSTDLDRCELVTRNGIPVTPPDRTVLDMARFLRGPALTNLVEEARRADLVDWSSLIACVSNHARQGRHGITRMRELIAVGAANSGITETDSETAALGLLREYNFGEPTLQHRVHAEDGRLVAEMDAAYLSDRVNFEIDGPVHLRPEVRLKDEARDHELRVVYGWTVRRIWYEIPVFKPKLFVEIVRQTFREARANRS